MPRVTRSITWFDKSTDEFVGEARLRGATLRALQELFHVPASDPMYGCFPVRRKHIEQLQKWVNVPIDLRQFDYFVEASAVPAGSHARKVRLIA